MNSEPDPNKDNWCSLSECAIGLATPYPGLLSTHNKEGALISKKDWILQEAGRWVEAMKGNENYDSTTFRYVIHTVILYLNDC